MPQLVGNNATVFVRRLEALECPRARLSDWERNFVEGMRERFETRETQADLGITMWNPSVKQWNQLGQLAREAGYHG